MVAPANTIGIFVQACWKAGHKSNFPQSHGYKKIFLTKILHAFKSDFISLTYYLLSFFLPPCLPAPREYQGCSWERHKHSLMLWSDPIMCSDTAIINEKINASNTTYQYTTGKTTWAMAEREVSRVCSVVIGNKVGTSADHLPAYGNWVWTLLFHHLSDLTLIHHHCGIKTNWHW